MILESGAVVDMDKNGELDLANGYSGSSPGHTYSSVSNEQRKEDGFGESQGYYNLCVNGDFHIVNNTDLKPEDTYFAWRNNELHFARYSSMSSDGYPCYQVSDETYDIRN